MTIENSGDRPNGILDTKRKDRVLGSGLSRKGVDLGPSRNLRARITTHVTPPTLPGGIDTNRVTIPRAASGDTPGDGPSSIVHDGKPDVPTITPPVGDSRSDSDTSGLPVSGDPPSGESPHNNIGKKPQIPSDDTRLEPVEAPAGTTPRHLQVVRDTSLTDGRSTPREIHWTVVLPEPADTNLEVPQQVTKKKETRKVEATKPPEKIDPIVEAEGILDAMRLTTIELSLERRSRRLILIGEERKKRHFPYDEKIRRDIETAYEDMMKLQDAPTKKLEVDRLIDVGHLLSGTELDDEARAHFAEAKSKITTGTFSQETQSAIDIKAKLLHRLADNYSATGDVGSAQQVLDELLKMSKDPDADMKTKSDVFGSWAMATAHNIWQERKVKPPTQPGEITPTVRKVFEEITLMPDKITEFDPHDARDSLLIDVTKSLIDAGKYSDAEVCVRKIFNPDFALPQLAHIVRAYAANGDEVGVKRIERWATETIETSFHNLPMTKSNHVKNNIVSKVEGYLQAGNTRAALEGIGKITDDGTKMKAVVESFSYPAFSTPEIRGEMYGIIRTFDYDHRTQAIVSIANIMPDTASAQDRQQLQDELTSCAASLQKDTRIGIMDRNDNLIQLAHTQIGMSTDGTYPLYDEIKTTMQDAPLSDYGANVLFRTQIETGDYQDAMKTMKRVDKNNWVYGVMVDFLPNDEAFITSVHEDVLAENEQLTDSDRIILFQQIAEKQIQFGFDSAKALRDLRDVVFMEDDELSKIESIFNLVRLYVQSGTK